MPMVARNYQVVIVGAGPVGLTLACKLAQRGLNVACFEEQDGLHAFPRAVGLDDESLRSFQGVELTVQDLAPCLMNCAGIKYYGERSQFLAVIHPKQTPYGHYKGASFYQPYLEHLLLARAKALGVELHFGHKVVDLNQDDEGATVQVIHADVVSTVRAAYVVGCDGSRSFVRKRLGIPFTGTTFEQKWLIVDTENDIRPERYAEVWCCSERPTVTIPRRQGYRRWEFMLKPGESEADYDSIDKIRPLLERHIRVQDIRIDRFNVYTFHSRLAAQYRVQRVFLAGDACHLIPPFMAQGMAAGIRDAENLGWKLAGVIRGELAPEVLGSYEQERKPHLMAMGKLSERAGAFMMPQSRWRSHAKDLVISVLGKLPGIMPAIEEARMRPEPALETGLFTVLRGDRSAGRMFPQPTVTDAQGRSRPLDDYLGEGFALVCYGAQEGELSPAVQRLTQRLGCRLVQIIPQGLLVDQRFGQLPGAVMVEDQHNAIPAWLGGHQAQFFLLRPDRYVLCGFTGVQQAEVEPWLKVQLLPPASKGARGNTVQVGEAICP